MRRAERALRALIVILACAAGAARAAGADGAVSLSVAHALGGLVRPGRGADISLRLLAGHPLTVRVELSGAVAPATVSLALDAGVPRELWVPLAVRDDGPVQARVLVDGRVAATASAWPALVAGLRETLVAVSTAQPLPGLPGVTLRPVAAATLPRDVAGYGPVSALVIDAAALERLDLRQQRALDAWLAGCGRTLLVGLPAPAAKALAGGAGCAAAAVGAVDDGAAAAASLPVLLAATVVPGPAPASLQALLPGSRRHHAAWTVVALLGAYLMAAVLSVRVRWKAWPALLPVATAVLAQALWNGAAPDLRMVEWLEGDGSGPARATARLAVDGRGRSAASVPLSPGLVPGSGAPRQVMTLNEHGRVSVRLDVATRLMSSTTLDLSGSILLAVPTTLSLSGGVPVVSQAGPGPSPPAVLLWRGRALRVPALEPGARWTPGGDAPVVDGPAVRLASSRTPAGSASLLLRADPARGAPPGTRRWLLLRAHDAGKAV